MQYAKRTIQGLDCFFTEHGTGEPLLFLHGGFDAVANYENMIQILGEKFHVIALDRRGHGKSPDDDRPFDIECMADEALLFMDQHKIERFHLMGFSDGANIGLIMAEKAANRVQSLIAVAGNYTSQKHMDTSFTSIVEQLSLATVKEIMPEVIEQYQELNPCPQLESYIAKTKEIWCKEPTIAIEILQNIQRPCLILAGDDDIILAEQSLEMKRFIKGAALALMPKCDHFFLQDFVWSNKSRIALELCIDFLQEHPMQN